MTKRVKQFQHQERKIRAEVCVFLRLLGKTITSGQVILRQTQQDNLVLDLLRQVWCRYTLLAKQSGRSLNLL